VPQSPFKKTEGRYKCRFFTILFGDFNAPKAVFEIDKAIKVMAGRSLDLVHGVR
jgi:hypothetical protein